MLDRVFVYGTLMEGGVFHGLVAPFVVEIVPARVSGTLLDLGSYPGWVAGPGTVHGEVLTLHPIEAVLPAVDELEDFHGTGEPYNLYERETVRVETDDGPTLAWVYRFCGTTEGAKPVPGGRWPTNSARNPETGNATRGTRT